MPNRVTLGATYAPVPCRFCYIKVYRDHTDTPWRYTRKPHQKSDIGFCEACNGTGFLLVNVNHLNTVESTNYLDQKRKSNDN